MSACDPPDPTRRSPTIVRTDVANVGGGGRQTTRDIRRQCSHTTFLSVAEITSANGSGTITAIFSVYDFPTQFTSCALQ